MVNSSAVVLAVLCVVAPTIPRAAKQPASEGQPHKWENVDKGLVDFLIDGFELKAVVCDTSEIAENRAASPPRALFPAEAGSARSATIFASVTRPRIAGARGWSNRNSWFAGDRSGLISIASALPMRVTTAPAAAGYK